MRGFEYSVPPSFFLFNADTRIPEGHPLRERKKLIDPLLKDMSPFFDKLYAEIGRPSIPPEQLLRALVLQALHTIRSERFLMEQIDLHLAYRWFVGLSADEPVWDPTTFTKNRDRLLEHEVSQEFFDSVRKIIEQYDLASDEHFSIDGTQLEAWASLKSFQRKEGKSEEKTQPPSDNDPGNPSVDFRGEQRCNDTHESKTDPDSRLSRKGKGKEAKRCYQGAILTENRHGLVMQAKAGMISGVSEREMAVELIDRERECQQVKSKRMTVGGDKAFDVQEFTEMLRKKNVTNHVAQREDRTSSIDGRTTRHPGYVISQRKRKRVEEVFGWGKTVGSLRKLLHRGDKLVNWIFIFRMGVYNLVRIRNILRETGTT
jgi:transposase